jgi:hypothetical protein
MMMGKRRPDGFTTPAAKAAAGSLEVQLDVEAF